MGRFCTNCGEPLKEGAKFCGGCGEPVGEVVDRRSAGAVRKTYRQSKHIILTILSHDRYNKTLNKRKGKRKSPKEDAGNC